MGTENYALANGNWSDDANWSLGHKPTTGEDAYLNNKIIGIDEDVTCDKVTNKAGGTAIAGGTMTMGASRVFNCNFEPGATTMMTTVHGGTVNGNVLGGTAINARAVFTNQNWTINGNLTGGSALGAWAWQQNGNTVTVNGNIIAGTTFAFSGVGRVVVNGKAIASTSSAATDLMCDVEEIEYATNGRPPTTGLTRFIDVTLATVKVYESDGSTNATLEYPSAGGGPLNRGILTGGAM